MTATYERSFSDAIVLWHHTVLPATRHSSDIPALTTTEAGTGFSDPGGCKAEVTQLAV